MLSRGPVASLAAAPGPTSSGLKLDPGREPQYTVRPSRGMSARSDPALASRLWSPRHPCRGWWAPSSPIGRSRCRRYSQQGSPEPILQVDFALGSGACHDPYRKCAGCRAEGVRQRRLPPRRGHAGWAVPHLNRGGSSQKAGRVGRVGKKKAHHNASRRRLAIMGLGGHGPGA